MDIFAVNMLLAALATHTTLPHGQRRDVLTAPADTEVRATRVQVAVVVTAVALSIGLAWVNTCPAKYCWLLIPLAHRVANRWPARTTPGTRAAGPAGR